MTGAAPRRGWISDRLAQELPGLGLMLAAVELDGRSRRSPRAVRARLARLADRFDGREALVLRQRPIPHAYRVFFRHVGIDPDQTPPPVEAAAIERLVRGGFPSRGRLQDACTVALMETGVPVWAIDADAVHGAVGLRLSGGAETLREGEEAVALPPERIVVADELGPLALLFGVLAPRAVVADATRRALLLAVQVAGVPSVHLAEALWICAETLRS